MEKFSLQWIAKNIIPALILLFILKLIKITSGAIIGIVIIAVAAVIVYRSIITRKKEKAFLTNASELIQLGKFEEALEALIKAETHWKLNAAHATPKQHAKDFERLQRCVLLISEACKASGRNVSLQTITDNLKNLIDIYSNKSNLIFGTNAFKQDKQKEVDYLLESLKRERMKLRDVILKKSPAEHDVNNSSSSFDTLMLELKDADWMIRQRAVRRIRARKDSSEIELLIFALHDKDSDITDEAAKGLFEITGQNFANDIQKWDRWLKDVHGDR